MKRETQTRTDVKLDTDVYVAGDHLPVLFRPQSAVEDLPDRSTSTNLVTEQDRDDLLDDHELALISWIAKHDLSVFPMPINGMANEYMAPVLLSTASRLIRRPVGKVEPKVRVGRVYRFDVEPRRRTDPPVLVMLPYEAQLKSAWDTYYRAIHAQIALMKDGARRYVRTHTEISLMRGLVQRKIYESTGHAERALNALDRAYLQFVKLAPGVLTREELVFTLKSMLNTSLAVGRLSE